MGANDPRRQRSRFGALLGCAEFERREQSGASHEVVAEFPFEQGELGMLAGCEFAPEGFSENEPVSAKHCTDPSETPAFARTVSCEKDGSIYTF